MSLDDTQLLTYPKSKDNRRLGIAGLTFNLLIFALYKLFNNKPKRALQKLASIIPSVR